MPSSPARSRAARASSAGLVRRDAERDAAQAVERDAGRGARPTRSRAARSCPRRREHVAGVRVGVEQPVVEDLAEERREQAPGELVARDRRRVERLGVADRAADDLLHHEHAAGARASGTRAGIAIPTSSARFSRSAVPTARLVQEVELLLEPGDQLLAASSRARSRGRPRRGARAARGEPQDRRVARDDLVDARPLDLDHHRRAVVRARPGASGRSTRRRAARTRTRRTPARPARRARSRAPPGSRPPGPAARPRAGSRARR